MDFIATDLDESWKAFQQPLNTYVQTFVAPKTETNEFLKLAQSGCTPGGCFTTGKQPKDEGPDLLPDLGIGPGITLPDNVTSPPADIGDDGTDEDTQELSEEAQCAAEQESEKEKDEAAQQVRDAIIQEIIAGLRAAGLEHGALIVSVDGQIYALPLVTGTARRISFNTFVHGPGGLIASNLTWSNIVGVVHSHPEATRGSAIHRRNTDLYNRGPSTGDLGLAEYFSQLGGGQDVTTYVISPEGDLLQYNGYSQPGWVSQRFTDEQIRNAIEAATAGNESDAAGECA